MNLLCGSGARPPAERVAGRSHVWALGLGGNQYVPARLRPGCCKEGVDAVSGTDKARNKAEELGGKAKEAVGKVTGDRSTENEGRGDQAKSNLKDAGEKVKDAFKK